ncbi:hypothetical protein E5D57_008881 [Metarhizium anisopliae]|nr:hypothetical protein E5D57_008881 [Metarhizium anisopliae]
MQYRNRPVSVAVDPISLVISECISITSAVQKHARSPHSSVSAILGGNPNLIQFGTAGPVLKTRQKVLTASVGGAENDDDATSVNNRWGLRGQKGKSMQDNPMIAAFGKLRHEIAAVKDVRTFDAPSLLAPFLLVIQAKGTAAPITILALGALRKFLAYGFVCSDSPRFALAMQSLSAAVTHCQFDISDSSQGEVVLLMILNLMEDMMSGPGGHILSDESVCDMMGRGLAICSQPRFSAVLRRTAEAAMVRMCQIIFEDVKHLELEPGQENDGLEHRVQEDLANLRLEEPGQSENEESAPNPKDSNSPRRDALTCDDDEHGDAVPASQSVKDTSSEQTEETEFVDLKPYSFPSVRELFRVLVNFLDPNDRQHTDTMRVMAMRILHVALEVSGPFITRHPALAAIAEDRLCCYLFQLVRSDNMAVLQESLIVTGTLLATCRGVLKLQQELYLSYLVACLHPTVQIPREPGIDPSLYIGIPETPKLVKPPPSQASSGRATPVSVKDRQKLGLEGGARKPDARQAMVETIGVLSRMPTFVAELFVNYDCDVDRADLCEDIIGLLSRNALPDSATWSTTSVPPLCLDALLRYIQFLAERLEDDPINAGFPQPSQLREQRRKKRIIVKGTSKFNEKPKLGLGYLEAQGIISDANNPTEVAKFLKGTSRVSKSVLGDYLSKKGNEAILKAFLDLFDFSGKRVDEALRVLLEAFRLPGEAPLIASIVECFSEKYCADDTPNDVANKDAVFILSYAIIILNTDQHNPNLKSAKRMTFEDFSRNLRGTNDGKDFAVEFLQAIFNSIKSNEIILPDEHDNKHAFDYAWRELLMKTETVGELVICNTNIYDADMFAATWKPIVSTLSYVFMSATDDAVFARIVTGFDECARIAAKYKNSDALDQIIYCLSHMSTLATANTFNTSLNTEIQVGDGSVMVSELAVKLGRDFRAQLATLVLFRVITGNEALIQQGWKQVLLEQIPEDDQAAVMTVKQDSIAPVSANTQVQAVAQPTYDPSVAYILEFCTILAVRTDECIKLMGKTVFDVVLGLLRDPAQWHPITLSRAIFHALSILKSSYDHDFVKVHSLLHTIANLPQQVIAKSSDTTLSGLSACTEEPGPLRSEIMKSPDFWAILRILAGNPDCATSVFAILENGATGSPPAIVADNYEAAIALLNFFASAAAPIEPSELNSVPNQRRVQKPLKPDNESVERGCRAIITLQHMTARVPNLMQQSRLETSEGRHQNLHYMSMLYDN